jgi:hypothetical protein
MEDKEFRSTISKIFPPFLLKILMTAVGAIQSLIRENSALNQKLKTVEASVESV